MQHFHHIKWVVVLSQCQIMRRNMCMLSAARTGR